MASHFLLRELIFLSPEFKVCHATVSAPHTPAGAWLSGLSVLTLNFLGDLNIRKANGQAPLQKIVSDFGGGGWTWASLFFKSFPGDISVWAGWRTSLALLTFAWSLLRAFCFAILLRCLSPTIPSFVTFLKIQISIWIYPWIPLKLELVNKLPETSSRMGHISLVLLVSLCSISYNFGVFISSPLSYYKLIVKQGALYLSVYMPFCTGQCLASIQ